MLRKIGGVDTIVLAELGRARGVAVKPNLWEREAGRTATRARLVRSDKLNWPTEPVKIIGERDIMIWWKKALILTALLFLLDGAFAIIMFQHIQNTAPNLVSESIRHEKLGSTCGMILSLGAAIIWICAFLNRKH